MGCYGFSARLLTTGYYSHAAVLASSSMWAVAKLLHRIRYSDRQALKLTPLRPQLLQKLLHHVTCARRVNAPRRPVLLQINLARLAQLLPLGNRYLDPRRITHDPMLVVVVR